MNIISAVYENGVPLYAILLESIEETINVWSKEAQYNLVQKYKNT